MKIKIIPLAMSTVFSMAIFSSCNADTSWCVKAGDITIPVGVYILAEQMAYTDAQSMIMQQSGGNLSADADILNEEIEGKKVSEFIKENAAETCKIAVAVEQLFKESNLSIPQEKNDEMQKNVDDMWTKYGKTFEEKGASKDSYMKLMVVNEKRQMLFDFYYSKDGQKAVSDEEIKKYYEENNIRIAYIIKYLSHLQKKEEDSSGAEESETAAEEKSDPGTADAAEPEESDSGSTEIPFTEEEIEAVKKQFENFSSQINNKTKSIADIIKEYSEKENKDDFKASADQVIHKSQLASMGEDLKKLFEEIEVNKSSAIKIQEMYFLGCKLDIAEVSQKVLDDETKRKNTLYEMKNEDFITILKNKVDELKVTVNDAAVKKFPPDIFKPKKTETSS